MSSRHTGIDILKLYATSDHKKWNAFLTRCVDNLDINTLARTRRELQIGMTDVVNKKLNNEKLTDFFIRLNRSLENTAKQIIRIRHPFPSDNPLSKHHDDLECKRARDKEVAEFMKRSAF